MLVKIWNWVVFSSVNEDKIAATVKGFLGVAVAIVTNILIIGHFNIDPAAVQGVADQVLVTLQAILLAISSLVGLVGFLRKIWTTLSGTNQVINNS